MAGNTSCRLCLITPAEIDLAIFPDALGAALGGGDVASLLIDPARVSPAALERIADVLVPIAQSAGVAALVCGDTQVTGRSRADGVHIDSGLQDVEAALRTFRGKKIVGAGGIGSRHEAMSFGEREPDYLFFGPLDGDRGPSIFPKTLELASWWSALFEIPAMVMGGREIDSVAEAAREGIDFVALRSAIWEHPAGPAAAVTAANRILAGREVAL